MKNLKFIPLFTLLFAFAISVNAQYDDVYYNPDEEEYSTDYVEYADADETEESDYRDNDEQYDDEDYEYSYSSRIRRFHRNSRLDYFSPYFIDRAYYDSYYNPYGYSTIYSGYRGYRGNRFNTWGGYGHQWNHWGVGQSTIGYGSPWYSPYYGFGYSGYSNGYYGNSNCYDPYYYNYSNNHNHYNNGSGYNGNNNNGGNNPGKYYGPRGRESAASNTARPDRSNNNGQVVGVSDPVIFSSGPNTTKTGTGRTRTGDFQSAPTTGRSTTKPSVQEIPTQRTPRSPTRTKTQKESTINSGKTTPKRYERPTRKSRTESGTIRTRPSKSSKSYDKPSRTRSQTKPSRSNSWSSGSYNSPSRSNSSSKSSGRSSNSNSSRSSSSSKSSKSSDSSSRRGR